jgi:hypothetical protein
VAAAIGAFDRSIRAFTTITMPAFFRELSGNSQPR